MSSGYLELLYHRISFDDGCKCVMYLKNTPKNVENAKIIVERGRNEIKLSDDNVSDHDAHFALDLCYRFSKNLNDTRHFSVTIIDDEFDLDQVVDGSFNKMNVNGDLLHFFTWGLISREDFENYSVKLVH